MPSDGSSASPTQRAYELIRRYYGDQVARRSGVPLINHIHEGLLVLEWLGASEHAKQAFCLHPLLQADADLLASVNGVDLSEIPPRSVILAMEYRAVANACLSHRTIRDIAEIRISVLEEVNQMLIADKVQNYKDFRLHHLESHPRSSELDAYFRNWLTRLDIAMKQFEDWESRLTCTNDMLADDACRSSASA